MLLCLALVRHALDLACSSGLHALKGMWRSEGPQAATEMLKGLEGRSSQTLQQLGLVRWQERCLRSDARSGCITCRAACRKKGKILFPSAESRARAAAVSGSKAGLGWTSGITSAWAEQGGHGRCRGRRDAPSLEVSERLDRQRSAMIKAQPCLCCAGGLTRAVPVAPFLLLLHVSGFLKPLPKVLGAGYSPDWGRGCENAPDGTDPWGPGKRVCSSAQDVAPSPCSRQRPCC